MKSCHDNGVLHFMPQTPGNRHYDHSNWSPGSGRTWTYSSGSTSEQCQAFMDAINCTDTEAIEDQNLKEELQLWHQRFTSLQVIGVPIDTGMPRLPSAADEQRVSQIPLDIEPPRVKRWTQQDEQLRQDIINELATSVKLEQWMPYKENNRRNNLEKRRLSNQLHEAFQIFARTTDLPRIITAKSRY